MNDQPRRDARRRGQAELPPRRCPRRPGRAAQQAAARTKRRLLIAALPIALALGGGTMWATGGRYIETEDAYVQQDRVSVMPEVSGQIAQVDVAENQQVKAGPDPLHHRRLDLPQRRRAGRARARLRPARGRAASRPPCSRPSPKPPTPATRWRRPRPRTTASSRCASPGSSARSAADDSALQLQIAKGNAHQGREPPCCRPRPRSPAIPTSPPTSIPRCCRRFAKLHAAELDLAAHRVAPRPTGSSARPTGCSRAST